MNDKNVRQRRRQCLFLEKALKDLHTISKSFLFSKMLLVSDREGQIRVDLVLLGILWYNHCIYLLYILPFKLHCSKIPIQRESSTSRNCNPPWYLTLIAYCITLPFELLTNTPASSCSACSCLLLLFFFFFLCYCCCCWC